MLGCCNNVLVEQYEETITVPEGHVYTVRIVYCKTCGSKKKTTTVMHEKTK